MNFKELDSVIGLRPRSVVGELSDPIYPAPTNLAPTMEDGRPFDNGLPECGLRELAEAPTILEDAQKIIYGDRQKKYGSARENFGNIAKMWSVILSKNLTQDVTPEQVILCMDALKTCRLVNSPNHRDSWMDKAGYVGCYDKIQRNE